MKHLTESMHEKGIRVMVILKDGEIIGKIVSKTLEACTVTLVIEDENGNVQRRTCRATGGNYDRFASALASCCGIITKDLQDIAQIESGGFESFFRAKGYTIHSII